MSTLGLKFDEQEKTLRHHTISKKAAAMSRRIFAEHADRRPQLTRPRTRFMVAAPRTPSRRTRRRTQRLSIASSRGRERTCTEQSPPPPAINLRHRRKINRPTLLVV